MPKPTPVAASQMMFHLPNCDCKAEGITSPYEDYQRDEACLEWSKIMAASIQTATADAWVEGARYAWGDAAQKVDYKLVGISNPLTSQLPRHVRNMNPYRDERK